MSDPFLPTPIFYGLDGPHHVVYQTPDDRWVYVLTGTALISFHATGQDWTRGTVEFALDIPGLPAGGQNAGPPQPAPTQQSPTASTRPTEMRKNEVS